jgi:hypothetical protein
MLQMVIQLCCFASCQLAKQQTLVHESLGSVVQMNSSGRNSRRQCSSKVSESQTLWDSGIQTQCDIRTLASLKP